VKRAALAFALAVALSGCANGPWDRTDRMLGYTALGAAVTDWGQARYIADNPGKYQDRNSFLGDHPSRGKVDAYFIWAIGGGYLLADTLPSRYRKLFLGGVALVEITVAHDNRQIGVGFSW
jgi:hypothetical protein